MKDASFVAEVKKNLIYHYLQKLNEAKLYLLTISVPTVNSHTVDVLPL